MVNVLEKLRTEAETEVEEVTKQDPLKMEPKTNIGILKSMTMNRFNKATNQQKDIANNIDENNAIKRENYINKLVKKSFLDNFETIKISFLKDPRDHKDYDENDSEFYQIYDNEVKYLGKIMGYKTIFHNKFNSFVYTLIFDNNNKVDYDTFDQKEPHIRMLNSTNTKGTEGTEGGSKRHKSTRKQTSKKKKKSRKSKKKSRKSRRKPNRSRR